MKRSDYENYVWYPLTDEEFWIEGFSNCYTSIAMPGIGGIFEDNKGIITLTDY